MANKLVALLLALAIFVSGASSIGTKDVLVRTAEVDSVRNIQNRYTGCFATSEITTSPDKSTVTLEATAKRSAEDILFDNVDYVVVSGEDAPQADDERNGGEEIEYRCTFDMNKLVFHFEAKLLDENGKVLETETIETDAFVTENGGLDACIVVDGQEYMLSDYDDASSIDNCSVLLTTIGSLIPVYLTVSETAERIKAEQNRNYNKKLEKDSQGVGTNRLVYNQHDTTTKYYKAGNYHFGFTTFAGVGCEVASVYNALVQLGAGKEVRLSDIIYVFETMALEFSVGWGYLGSSPWEINRVLDPLKNGGFRYKKYTSWDSFNKAVTAKKNCHIIMSRWNKSAPTLHTFYVKKEAASAYYGYNWRNAEKTSRSAKQATLSAFNNGAGFIVGYIVWKE